MANVISVDAGLSAGAKLPRAKLSMHHIRKSRTVFQKFRASNSSARSFISISPVRFSSRRKRSIGHYVAGPQKNGCGGATNTFLASLRFLNWLQLHRTTSRVRLGNNAITLGKRRSVPNLFLGASLVSARARSCLFDRVRFTLDPDRRSRRIKWHFANQRLFVTGAPRDWIQNSLDSADTLLV